MIRILDGAIVTASSCRDLFITAPNGTEFFACWCPYVNRDGDRYQCRHGEGAGEWRGKGDLWRTFKACPWMRLQEARK